MTGNAYDDIKNTKIEDILKSIRGIIDNHSSSKYEEENIKKSEKKTNLDKSKEKEENVLELTSIIGDDELQEHLVSEQTRKSIEAQINRYNDTLKAADSWNKNEYLESIVNSLVRPLIKDWLDNNLPKIVEKIVSEEIKKIVPK